MNKLHLLFLSALLLPLPTPARDDVQPIIYNRVTITLIPKPEAKVIPAAPSLPEPKPVQPADDSNKGKLFTKADEAKDKELKISKIPMPANPMPEGPPPRVPIDFLVDMKAPSFLTQTDFITHTSFAEHEGLLILIDPADVATLEPTNMVSTSDVIFINEDGVITKIAPNLDLATLSEPISSGKPVRAFLFIKPGGVEADRIVPGDRFENSIFKTHPIILQ